MPSAASSTLADLTPKYPTLVASSPWCSRIIDLSRPAHGTPLHAPHLTHDLNSSPHRAWEEPSRLRYADAMHHRVALLPLRGDHRHAALEAQQCHNVLLMPRALLAASRSLPPSCKLLAALRLGAAGRPDDYVRPRFDHDHTDHSGRFLVVTIGLTPILTCNKHPIYAASA